MIRLFDFLISLIAIIYLFPVFLLIFIIIRIDSRGGAFYFQSRVGKGEKDFRLIKFRTMRVDADKSGGLTIGARDNRITKSGFLLRKYKLDELPQLINVLKGEMSLVGPRPEIRKYTELYTVEQRKVLSVRPGITDYASIEYIDENELLGHSADPEKTYIEVIMPAKIGLNMIYINNRTVGEYFKILGLTIFKILR
jgi:lipopolysaccharide/colanic/teichoic acid biosynthesis glycosyltransferase